MSSRAHARTRGAPQQPRRRGLLARRPAVLARKPHRIRRPPNRRRDLRVGPAAEIGDVLGVGGQARHQGEPALMGRGLQPVELRPRRLGVDVVDGHRGDTAPIIDACVEQPGEVVAGQVGRGLKVDARRQKEPRDGDRPEVVFQRGFGIGRHPRLRLGAEVLDDHLLKMAVFAGERAQREQRIDPLLARLPDPDEDAARERDLKLTGQPDCLQPRGGILVGCTPVRPAALTQPRSRALEHDPHRRRHGSQAHEVVARHHARIEMRQQAGLRDHRSSGMLQVLEGGGETHLEQLVASHAVAKLRLVTKREQCLATARRRAGASDRQHLVDREEGPLAAARWTRERAVATDVAAQRRQGDEDLG